MTDEGKHETLLRARAAGVANAAILRSLIVILHNAKIVTIQQIYAVLDPALLKGSESVALQGDDLEMAKLVEASIRRLLATPARTD